MGKPVDDLLNSLMNLLDSETPSGGGCHLCDGLLSRELGKMLRKALSELEGVELSSVKSGVSLPAILIEREDRIRANHNPPKMRSLKVTLTRLLDVAISSLTGLKVSQEPDAILIFDFERGDVKLELAPVFIFGRYRKLQRGISQSRRKCPECGGRGCEACGWKGKIPQGSVEGIVGEVMREFFSAEDYVLHGAGREDVDARMLGEGRPFVMELLSPKRRSADLREVESEINRRAAGLIEVKNLEFSRREKIRILKERSPNVKKLYRALVEVEGGVEEGELELLKGLEGAVIRQRTPKRVLWRRADITRLKRVYEVNFRRIDDKKFELFVLCDGGLYVKELISGDDGRTSPSVTEILGKKSFCSELDVLEVMVE
ncbi:Predicted pseudouridylate synthase [Candidatus Korarchaeum cryptofilum OPF8]|uniref:tRNA pseudouridine synthase Pus10 n=2 Tax=Candidatus Korarchaeum cryptofilum TaxID=498846 RepID=PUS10_KORCO|nr:RecName: Full=tRNA pseudouridine synthase Pus10; AltName: Full=tRNA pseudouridine 54/55 synthase; Short=Psi54/55 synthase [Candidatus Korarchaeum cryptofilum OPF8]ACB08336.1 Predicted pseudouridylate synthase [Candidatus Korarchaeum cryptofilum OPF8]